VKGALSSIILEANSGRGINMMQIIGELLFMIVGSPGGASVEELVSQLPKDVMGLGLTKRIQERAPLPPFCIPPTGRVCYWVPAVRSL
jgi:hypothetical protein